MGKDEALEGEKKYSFIVKWCNFFAKCKQKTPKKTQKERYTWARKMRRSSCPNDQTSRRMEKDKNNCKKERSLHGVTIAHKNTSLKQTKNGEE